MHVHAGAEILAHGHSLQASWRLGLESVDARGERGGSLAQKLQCDSGVHSTIRDNLSSASFERSHSGNISSLLYLSLIHI